MKFVVFAALLLVASVASAFHIVPPSSITACAPLTVEYDTTTGQPPFSLSFHTGSADGPIAAAFTSINGTSFTWGMVTIPAGTSVVIVLADSVGHGSDTPVITVSAGPSDVCIDTPTSIPSLPPVTSTSPPTSTFNGSSIPTTNTTSVSSPTPSSSISSLSSLISSANSQLSSLTNTSPKPTATGGLSTSGGVVNTAGFFSIGAIAAIVGVLLA